MIECVAHCGDVHIMKDSRHEEYRKVFNIFYDKLKEIKPDRIVVNGDTWNDWVDVRSEGFILLGEFLNKLSFISKVIVTKGNHDFSRKNLNRIDTIRSITTLLNNRNITYYDKTGFYEDENIIWAVWDNADRGNPWKLYPTRKDETKIYIDLYHDPIENVKLYNGLIFNKKNMPSVKDLLGDISMLNDIHLFQSFDNGKKAYSSSMIQQNYGETTDGHGFLKWSISNKSFEFIELPNDHAFIKFTINPGQNYDKLKLNSNYVVENNKFRVEWNDYAAMITNENEIKIRKYLKKKYDAIDIEIKPNRIYTDIKDGKMLSEIIDINNKEVQQKIIKQFLEENKFKDDFINQLFDIDDVINDRLELSENKNIIWNIDKLWFSNFKSYGDNNIIDWSDVIGIINLSGLNQSGKTSIIDAICFILYGNTLSTMKSEKNGNSRFINKYRDLNYCEGGCVLDVNGEKYIMQRRVDKEIKKGIIKSCPMILNLYKGTEMTDENKLTGENKIKTQQLLDDVLGDFSDFIRMALTTADNLNQLLSVDRSVFIDSIVKDAGYDIFEKKLEEFKEYKKELNIDKINLNEIDIENQINKLDDDLKDKKDYLSDVDLELEEIETQLENETKIKEEHLRKLHKIDDSLIGLNINEVKNKIEVSNKSLKITQLEIDEMEMKCEYLPSDFNTEYADGMNEQYEKFVNEKNKRNLKVVEMKSTIIQNENKILNVDKDIENEKLNYLKNLKDEIKSLEIELKTDITKKENDINQKITILSTYNDQLLNKINDIKTEGIKIKKEIELYSNMKNGDDKICPTCNQLILTADHNHINNLITNNKNKLNDLAKTAKSKMVEIEENKIKIDELEKSLTKYKEDINYEYELKINKFQFKLDNFDVKLIKENINSIIINKNEAIKENDELKIKLKEYTDYLQRLEIEIDKKLEKVNLLKDTKIKYEEYKDLQHKIQNLYSHIKDFHNIIDENNRIIKEYEKNINAINENHKINVSIEISNFNLKDLKDKKTNFTDDKLSYSNEIILLERVIEDLKIKLSKYREQQQLEELHNVYLKLMHRTGLPTYLLTKNIDLLNKELAGLLTNTDFVLFFDEDLNLKLQHNGKSGSIDAISASGMERTFCAIVLKCTLRIINFKSKPNFMFMDEILNRLVNKSVEKFMELLETLKTKIDKIVIIEHNNEIQSDLIIQVTKDENGISSFEII